MRKILTASLVMIFGLSSLAFAADPPQNQQQRQNQQQSQNQQQRQNQQQHQEEQNQNQQRYEAHQRRDQQRYEDQRQYEDQQRRNANQTYNRQQQNREDQQRYEERQRSEAQQRLNAQQRNDSQQRKETQQRVGVQQGQRRYNWSNSRYQSSDWNRTTLPSDYYSPFSWHDSRGLVNERFRSPLHQLEQIRNRDWDDRFPGLHSYRWHDSDYGNYYNRGFWYRGRRIHECILFFDDFDQLVSVGFVFDNVFIFIRDDGEVFDNRDSGILVNIILRI